MGKALKQNREDVVIATKLFLNKRELGSGGNAYQAIKKHLEGSMKRLQVDMVDLYYLHRTSGGVAVEAVAEAMGRLIEEGEFCSLEEALNQCKVYGHRGFSGY